MTNICSWKCEEGVIVVGTEDTKASWVGGGFNSVHFGRVLGKSKDANPIFQYNDYSYHDTNKQTKPGVKLLAI